VAKQLVNFVLYNNIQTFSFKICIKELKFAIMIHLFMPFQARLKFASEVVA